MAEKIWGAFYPVSEKVRLDFEKNRAINLNLDKCGKGELKVLFSDEENEYNFFVGGHSEAQNGPEVNVEQRSGSIGITVEQENPYAEGMLHLTLYLPKKKFSGLRCSGKNMEYDIEGGEIYSLNLSNEKGRINVNAKSQNVAIYSKYYPINATIEVDGKALVQIGSRIGDVTLIIENASHVDVKRKPDNPKGYIFKPKKKENGFQVDVYFPERASGEYRIL